ncbi:hypothetical protein [Methylocystis bryophila]|uniref:DNA-binding protein n=1 Tax=Methylocystis bryophila TaxID=655015 RepID=A0A1W6MW64_9HYPH|nr:hypothetical protein [Methylocystis bryophila]ARN81832.1 hypothetical protein B1812_12915 [Methylocystis bryophila]BDV37905.1 hypothetical protein DSM21852_11580 [Methylocystis bryophila]
MISARLSEIAAELRLSGDGSSPAPARPLNSGEAMRLTRWSHSKLTRLARARPDIAWKTQSGGWLFDRAGLLAYVRTPRDAHSLVEK